MDSQVKRQFEKVVPKLRVYQGDILRGVKIIAHTGFAGNGDANIDEINLEYAVVISQDCDLQQDFDNRIKPTTHDKFIPNVIILPAYLSDDFKGGRHLIDGIAQVWNSDLFKKIKQNQNPRFHFIDSDRSLQVPELVIDFKHVYSINRDVLYSQINQLYLATICELYRENLTLRYSWYLSRIGLPDLSSV